MCVHHMQVFRDPIKLTRSVAVSYVCMIDVMHHDPATACRMRREQQRVLIASQDRTNCRPCIHNSLLLGKTCSTFNLIKLYVQWICLVTLEGRLHLQVSCLGIIHHCNEVELYLLYDIIVV